MNYRQIGNSGVTVSEIGFGAWGIGGIVKDSKAYGPTDDNVSRLALRKAFDSGITFYDTAALYGYGHSEELIGSSLNDVRDKIVIASKVGYLNFQGEQDFSEKHIRKSLECTLSRLKTDYLDLYQLHDPPMQLLQKDNRIVSTLNNLKQEGKIKIFGISVSSPDDCLISIEQFNFNSVQINFNLVDQRAIENNLFEKCKEKGVGIIVRTPLCFGFLTGKYGADDHYAPGDQRGKWDFKQKEMWANAYELFASDSETVGNQTSAQVALRFCLSYPQVATVIPGMLTVEHVEENVQSIKFGRFSTGALEQFNDIYRKHQFFTTTG